MNLSELTTILEELSEERPAFCSEADFQFELANWIREKYKNEKNTSVWLEYPIEKKEKAEKGNKYWYIDIVLKRGNECIPIELKYKTKKDIVTIRKDDNDASIELRNQAAQDIGRYLFLKDINRLEELVRNEQKNFVKGYAIFLTNDSGYWQNNGQGCIYQNYSLKGSTENREKDEDGKLCWHNKNNKDDPAVFDKKHWTQNGQYSPIGLRNNYSFSWKGYGSKYGFQYLICQVERDADQQSKVPQEQ